MDKGRTLFALLMDVLPWRTLARLGVRDDGDHRVRARHRMDVPHVCAGSLTSGGERALPLPLKAIDPLPLHGLRKAYLVAIIAW
jgi:hypothetical protein